MLCRDLSEFPASLSAGDSWSWTVQNDSALSAGSTLIYSFRAMIGTALLSVSGTLSTDGLSFVFAATPQQTSALLAGIYRFAAYLTVDGARSTIRTGQLKVLPNLADPNAETRTQAEIDLADAETALAAIRKNPNSSYTTTSGTFTKQNLAALRAEVDRLTIKVRAERGQGGVVAIRTAFGGRWDRMAGLFCNPGDYP